MCNKPSWLALSPTSFRCFLDYIYLGEEGVPPATLDAAWTTCGDPSYWSSHEHTVMARIVAANGLAVATWIGAAYLTDMIAEYLALEV